MTPLADSSTSQAMQSPDPSLTMGLLDLTVPAQPFRFFDLPFELRSNVLGYILITIHTIDLDSSNYRAAKRRLAVFMVSHRFHAEASHVFYSNHTFRIFPTNGRFFGGKTLPLLARLPLQYQKSLVSLELRLGPGWTCPPRSWRVNDELGLQNMIAVRVLKVFVEVDPSHDIFRGFRVGKDFYTQFSTLLLEKTIERLPALERVELDGWPSVMREGLLMSRLLDVAKASGKTVLKLGYHKMSERSQNLSTLDRQVAQRIPIL